MNGVYCRLINMPKGVTIEVGALGRLQFKKGHYVYVGSAQNGIEKRVGRHMRKSKKKRWHIDYLLANARVAKVLYKKAGKEEECRIASFLSLQGIPVQDFGCSDCKCRSHLFMLENFSKLRRLRLKEL